MVAWQSDSSAMLIFHQRAILQPVAKSVLCRSDTAYAKRDAKKILAGDRACFGSTVLTQSVKELFAASNCVFVQPTRIVIQESTNASV
jgi:hypothetical protein